MSNFDLDQIVTNVMAKHPTLHETEARMLAGMMIALAATAEEHEKPTAAMQRDAHKARCAEIEHDAAYLKTVSRDRDTYAALCDELAAKIKRLETAAPTVAPNPKSDSEESRN